jgi:dTDP-4-amino-4,6-dideoxygalactose transaminase
MQPVPQEEPVSGVPLLDLKAQYAPLRDEVEAVISEVCDSQHFVMGPKVTALEEEIAAYSHARHGIGVSSGTDALLVALMALEVGSGDEVITTPFTFFATGGVVARLGARPVFCDIEPNTYNLDPESVREFLEERCERRRDGVFNRETGGRVRVLMPVHLFGQMADMDALLAIAGEYGLRVVEDAAQAIGSEDSAGRRAGSVGDIGCFSFFPSKNLGAFGDGGMCVTNDDVLAESLRILRLHGGKPKYYHAVVGGNFRLDALQAAVLLVKMRHLDEWTEGRQRNAGRYDELFRAHGHLVKSPARRDGVRHIFNQYTIRVDRRDKLRTHLSQRNVGSEVYYPVPLHLQRCFSDLGYQRGDCPESESASSEVLSIPIYPELTSAQQRYVVEAITEFLAQGD